MTNIEKFAHYIRESFSNAFAIFDTKYNCIFNENFHIDLINSAQNELKNHYNKNGTSDFGLVIKEINFDDEVYFLVTCCKDDENKYRDTFLSKVAFLFDDLDYGIIVLKDKEPCYRNRYLAEYLGYQLQVKDSHELYNQLRPKAARSVQAFISSDSLDRTDIHLHLKDGRKTWVTLGKNIFTIYGHEYMVISLNDFTEEKHIKEQVVSEKEYLNRTLESVQEGVVILDKVSRITFFNKNAEVLTGKKRDKVFMKHVYNEIYLSDQHMNPLRFWESGEHSCNAVLFTHDGLHRDLHVNVSDIQSTDGKKMGKVIVLNDISESKRREDEILYLSYHDVLTGLYNRAFFEEEIKRLDTVRQLPLSIIMGDVNGLKLTNDVFGHIAGDELLRKVADILTNAARQEDIIARWGGDEFIILLPSTDDVGARLLVERINQQFLIDDNQKFMQGFSPSISLGFGVKRSEEEDIYEILKVAESNMYKQKMLSKESIYSGVITSMKTALYEKSNETEEHTNRLYESCLMIANHYDLTDEELNELEILCMLHDIGKIGIDDTILKKPGKLTDDEWVEMRKHPEIGFRIAQATPELSKVSLFILYHHEKFDGTGYPKGIKAYEIPLINRILSVADAFDAMTNDRTYRKALPVEEAIREIEENKGTQFDPLVVDAFLSEIKKGSSI